MKNVAVIGAGTMGNGIAHTFAQSDYRVQLIDISEESLKRGMATIAKNLDRMVAKGSITETDKEKTLANITTYTNLERSEEHTSELQSRPHLVCRLLLEKKKKKNKKRK